MKTPEEFVSEWDGEPADSSENAFAVAVIRDYLREFRDEMNRMAEHDEKILFHQENGFTVVAPLPIREHRAMRAIFEQIGLEEPNK